MMKHIEKIANLAIVVAVIVFLIAVARGNLLQRSKTLPGPVPTASAAQVGSMVSLPGVRFSAQHDSLLLGISTTCHFCKDSLPFYKQLAAQLQGKVDIIAVLPQAQPEAESFIKEAGLNGVRVVSADLSNIGVHGTPTLLLVDTKGKVKATWVGKLDTAHQQQAISATIPNDPNVTGRG
jgi:thioredoxin-related protein